MVMVVKAHDLKDLWDKVNETFVYQEDVVDFARPGVSLHSYHNLMIADNCECDLTLTDLGYTKTKWSMLLRLYFDEHEYRMLINRLRFYKAERRGKVYVPDLGMQFRSRENRTGACLMGLTLRFSEKTGWECSVFSRTNETTARWSVDLIFLNRLLTAIGEETGFFTTKDVKLYWMAGSLFQSVVTAPLYMVIMGREKEILQMAKRGKRGELTKWQMAIVKRYGDSYNPKYSSTGQLKYQNYKSQVRVTEAYQHLKGTGTKIVKPVANEDLLIPHVDLTIEDNFFTRKGFR